MKGLLVKDFQILLQQKKTLMLMVLISALLMFTVQDVSFIAGYVTIVASFIAIGTISYDEIDNGYTFLFTLPVERRSYVMAKYILSVVVSIAVWGLLNIFMAVIMRERYHVEDFGVAACILVGALIMQFVMIPLQLKYGAEKSRVVYVLIVGIIVLLGFVFAQFSEYLPDMTGVLTWLEGLGIPGLAGIIALTTAIVALISFLISCRVMKRKQF